MRYGTVAWVAEFGVAMFPMAAVAAEPAPTEVERVQAALDTWLEARAPIEKVTGIAAYISFGATGPAIEAFSGTVGRAPDAKPVDQKTLYQMGSTSKSFTAAVILNLEADGKLSLDDTLGKWLPEYPAWSDVTVRRLLNMTSGIPNYSETEWVSAVWSNEPERSLTLKELADAAYPSPANQLPVTKGYHYSNTNYVLAAMSAEKASGMPFRDLVQKYVIAPHELTSTFYEPSHYPPSVMDRLSHGYFENEACAEYQPECKETWNAPLIGRDVREYSVSWMQSAGGAVSSARDVDRWMRAVFAGKVVPAEQQAEWTALVSMKSGEPIADVSADDPGGFSLGLVKKILGPFPAQWFYEGESLGYRTLYVWFTDEDLMITVQTNSQPPDGADKLSDAVTALYQIVGERTAD
jgi:D-alanyl-D-alanine carboxypeptidase